MFHKIGISPSLFEDWAKLGTEVGGKSKVRELFVDKATGLPMLPLFIGKIKEVLQERKELGLLYVDVVKYVKIEEIYGWQEFDGVMRAVAEFLSELTSQNSRGHGIVLELMICGNAFVILLFPSQSSNAISNEDLIEEARRVQHYLRDRLKSKLSPLILGKFGCYAGGTILKYEDGIRLEELVYFGLERALRDARWQEAADIHKRAGELKKIVEGKDIHTLFYPIINLVSGRILGHEALCSGPAQTEFERVNELFRPAYDEDIVLELDRLCRRKALESAKNVNEDHLLFFNIEPESIDCSHLWQMVALDFFDANHIHPDRVVLEIAERFAVSDFTPFLSALRYFRGLGFKISIVNAGAGYASLRCIAEIQPDFMKIDVSLIRDIDQDVIKQQLVKALVGLTRSTAAILIAEGIETPLELKTLVDLDVELGQGFLLARPSESFVKAESFEQL